MFTSRWFELGRIFVPAETNPLVDILRAKWIHSPIKRTSPRKARQPSSSPSRLQQIGTSGAIEGAVEPGSNDARTKVPRKTKPKASSKAVLKNKKQVGRKSQVSRDEGEQPQPEAGEY